MFGYFVIFSLVFASALAASPWHAKNVSHRRFNGRIVGGSDAPDGKYPYQASLQVFGFHFCGSSIIDNEWILTAAHCVNQYPASYYSLHVGSNDLTGGGTVYKVLEFYAHEEYDPTFFKNDIGLVKVEPITFTEKVQPVVLESEEVGGDEPCVFSGWGTTEHPNPNYPMELQHLQLKTTSLEYCRERFAPYPVAESEVCALSKAGEGMCYGDSGSPLVRNVDGIIRQIGISGWGMLCARGYPDVFGRVSSQLTWIREKCNCV